MSLHVKYCGGCNPYYDRVKLAGEVAKLLGEPLVYTEEEDVAYTLCLSGCDRSCADDGEHLHLTKEISADEVALLLQNQKDEWGNHDG